MSLLTLIVILGYIVATTASPVANILLTPEEHHRSKRNVLPEIYTLDGCQPGSTLDSDLDPSFQQQIVDYHNSVRSEVASTNMFELTWSEERACQAQRTVDLCEWAHNNVKQYAGAAVTEGQNLAAMWIPKTETTVSYARVLQLMNALYDENENYNFNNGTCAYNYDLNEFELCLHYMQFLLAESTVVGAACKICDIEWIINGVVKDVLNEEPYNALICGWMYDKVITYPGIPYEEGDQCTNCMCDWKKCPNGLCVKCADEFEEGCTAGGVCEDNAPGATCYYVANYYYWCDDAYGETNCQKTCGYC